MSFVDCVVAAMPRLITRSASWKRIGFAAAALFCLLPPALAEAPRTNLAGHVLPALTESTRIARKSAADGNDALTLTVVLKRDDEAGFQQFLAGVHDPASPDFRHFSDPVSLANRFHHACAVLDDFTVRCFGANEDGQLGDGTTSATAITTAVTPNVANVAQVVVGQLHTCALIDQRVTCWGSNTHGQLGDFGADRKTPGAPIGTIPPMTLIAAGQAHTCGLTTAGEVFCWGDNDRGQIGLGDMGGNHLPSRIPLPHAREIALGGSHTCALTDDGVFCWGFDNFGQLRDDAARVDQPSPRPVAIACP